MFIFIEFHWFNCVWTENQSDLLTLSTTWARPYSKIHFVLLLEVGVAFGGSLPSRQGFCSCTFDIRDLA